MQQCESFFTRFERRLEESTRESLTEVRTRLERMRPRRPSVQIVQNLDHRGCFGERVASEVRHRGRCVSSGQETGGCKVGNFASEVQGARGRCVSSGQETGGCKVGNASEVQGAIPMMPRHVPNDVMSWFQDRQGERYEEFMLGDLHHITSWAK